MARYYYSRTVYNDYLGVSKVIKGETPYEVEWKAANQLEKWREQEQRKRAREAVADMKAQAEDDTAEALEQIESYKGILNATLKVNDKLKWESLYDRKRFRKFSFAEVGLPPLERTTYLALDIPKKSLWEALFPSLRKRRLDRTASIERVYREQLLKLLRLVKSARERYELERQAFLAKQQEFNAAVDKFKSAFERGDFEAIEKYVRLVLERSKYPDAIPKEFEVQFEPNSKTAIIDYALPNPHDLPRVIEYKFVASTKQTKTAEMKKKDFDAFYESVVYQVTLRTIHEVFESVYIPHMLSALFNGWVEGTDASTGNDFRSCILSVQATREAFEKINLEKVDPKECFRALKGIHAGPLANLAPVKPIMEIKRTDSRFIESREILAGINSIPNLATMDWADFEHLVRELFARYFSSEGAEVHVTQSSRDEGVDAIAFDPDPIRGGKFVIQAKRYNNVVPPSAVRDLYGTMINEGATKGILVTTSYFGIESREFAKDKPITLIDGSNLVYLFQQYGYDVRIKLTKQ